MTGDASGASDQHDSSDGNGDHEHADHDYADHDHADSGHGHGSGEGGEHEGDDHGEQDHHHHHHHDLEALGVGVVTVSSSRTLEDDPSGDVIAAAFEAAGHAVSTRELVGDDYDRVQSIVARVTNRKDVDVVVSTGGTGVTPDDVTVEAVSPLFEKSLPGFGELFRRLSYDEVGTRVVGTRAVAGIADGVPVFCLPGSENAARLGVEDIILPEAPHLAGLARRDEDEE